MDRVIGRGAVEAWARSASAREVEREIRNWHPRSLLGKSVFRALKYLPPELGAELVDRMRSIAVMESRLSLTIIRWQGRFAPLREDLGVVGYKVVTNAGVGYIVDAFQNSVEPENMKYHGIGTGSTAEAAGDTALVTELTTEYNPDNTRATGTTAEGASANIFQTVATNTLDGTPGAALREHGVFSQAATGGGVLLDRTVFAAITLSSGDSLQSTYELTFTAGS